jgi:hypothetical protein
MASLGSRHLSRGDVRAPTAASAVESPPTGIPPSTFATDYKGCLGQLRSKIARGEFAGVGPFGQQFTGQVNPSAHQGTVGEEEFLRNVLDIADPAAFCAQFGEVGGTRSVK